MEHITRIWSLNYMVVYFSGTGNSRYVAKQIAEKTGDTIYDAAECIRLKIGDTLASAKPFVFVAPVYVAAPPLDFMDFFKKCHFEGNQKVYFLMTCAGAMGASPVYCKELANDKGLEYMGTASVILPQNYIAYFSMKSPEENSRILENAQPAIASLAQHIAAGNPFPDLKAKAWEVISTKMILKPYYKWFITAKQFRVTETCIGCGKCEKVCPLGNIRMNEKLPSWADRCTHCMACINLCPMDAIEYGKGSVGKIRYRGPEPLLKQTATADNSGR